MIKDEPSVLDSDTNSDSTELCDDADLLIESYNEFDLAIMYAFKFDNYLIILLTSS